MNLTKRIMCWLHTARNQHQDPDPAPMIGHFSSSESVALDVREVAHILTRLNHQQSLALVVALS